MSPELSAAISVLALAVAGVLAVVIKRVAVKNGNSKPPPAAPPAPAADSGSYLTIPALIGEQLSIHLHPVSQRLDRIESGQKDQTTEIGALAQRVAGVEARLDERKLKS